MVSTRGHPDDFPEPDLSPSKSTPTRSRKSKKWRHTPSNLMLIWFMVSLPLVSWDTGYVLLRPHSMPGGSLHWPVWVPYDLYGRVDFIYGWPAFNAHNGFTAAQSTMNIVELLMDLYYLYLVFSYGKKSGSQGHGASKKSSIGILAKSRYVEGGMAALAVLVLFTAATMTLSKTVLYMLNEYFSGFHNIGHNSLQDLIFLWIIPNGSWIILPAYIMYVSGVEILHGLTIAAGGAVPSSDETALIKAE